MRPRKPRKPPPEVQEWVSALNQRRRDAELEAEVKDVIKAERDRLPSMVRRALARLPANDPQRDPFRRSRLRERAARGGAASARKKLAKYAQPDEVRTVVAAIDRDHLKLSRRKRNNLIRRQLDGRYPVRNFYRWLNACLKN